MNRVKASFWLSSWCHTRPSADAGIHPHSTIVQTICVGGAVGRTSEIYLEGEGSVPTVDIFIMKIAPPPNPSKQLRPSPHRNLSKFYLPYTVFGVR